MADLIRDVDMFRKHFGFPVLGANMPEAMLQLRATIMLEEVLEYIEAVGLVVEPRPNLSKPNGGWVLSVKPRDTPQTVDAELTFDALIDIVYATLVTNELHGFPFNAGWQRVHAANMRKQRANMHGESKRGSSLDIIKPQGWVAPTLRDLLPQNGQDS